MILNKFILHFFHFFGLMSIDDITIFIPTEYPENDFDRYGTLINRKDSEWVIDDIKSYIYNLFERNKKIEKNCNITKQVFIHTVGLSVVRIDYIDNELFYPSEEDKIRKNRLENILYLEKIN